MKYDVSWRGLDQGVEFTQDPEIIDFVLQQIAQHGSFDYGDSYHPIWDALETRFPNRTWRSSSQSDFRPLFRRSNTWQKLGLVRVVDRTMTLTPLANDYLLGLTTLEDIIINACGSHYEDGEYPFAIIASAFLEHPTEVFTVEDIEYAVAGNYRPGVDSIERALITARNSGQRVEDTRRRRVRSMLNYLINTKGISGDSQSGWSLHSRDRLLQLLNASNQAHLASILPTTSGTRAEPSPSRPIQRRAYVANSGVAEFRSRLSEIHDPQKRMELLEKATQRHSETLDALAEYLSSFGIQTYEDPFSFDLFAENNGTGYLFEVKSWNPSNLKEQIRKAVSQLYEYRWRAGDELPDTSQLLIVLDRDPTDFLDDWIPVYLRDDRGIVLTWIDPQGHLTSYGGIISLE